MVSKRSGHGGDKGEDKERDPTESGRGHGEEHPMEAGAAPEGPAAALEIEVLKKELADKEVMNQELIADLKRLMADSENFRKRMVKEQTRILEVAEAGLAKKLLETLDNLERAMVASEKGHDYRALKDGVSLTLNQVFEILKKEGLEAIDPLGEPFDPNYHEAVMKVENDKFDEDIISAVLQKGYMFKDRLLRPAKVEVSAGKEARREEG